MSIYLNIVRDRLNSRLHNLAERIEDAIVYGTFTPGELRQKEQRLLFIRKVTAALPEMTTREVMFTSALLTHWRGSYEQFHAVMVDALAPIPSDETLTRFSDEVVAQFHRPDIPVLDGVDCVNCGASGCVVPLSSVGSRVEWRFCRVCGHTWRIDA